MKKNKILSVVVPTYNVEKYLDRCLMSLVYDTEALKLVDIIIVNDGSKDGSLKIAKKYEERFPDSIRVIDKENGGHGSTINTGLQLAIGKYFKIVDSDDWVNIDNFGNYVHSLSKLDVDMVLTNYSRELVYSGQSTIERYKNLDYDKKYNLDSLDLSLLGDGYFYLATTAIKTEKLIKSKLVLDEHTFYVDMEYIILPIAHISTFTYLDYDIYRYWIGRPNQSIDRRNSLKNRAHHEKVLKRLIEFYTEEKLSENKKKYIENIIVLMLNTHYFIFCGQKVSLKIADEIRSFDKWLKRENSLLYRIVSEKFTYINHYRKTNFIFASFIQAPFFRISEVVANRQKLKRGA